MACGPQLLPLDSGVFLTAPHQQVRHKPRVKKQTSESLFGDLELLSAPLAPLFPWHPEVLSQSGRGTHKDFLQMVLMELSQKVCFFRW
jgi:hypothetical protein